MNELINDVIQIAFKAGDKIMSYYGSTDFITKDDKSPLTNADIQSHNIIFDGLSKVSNIKINSEENVMEYDTRKYEKYLWLVDPLDGTKDFLDRNDEFTINIALIKYARPILGIVYAPALKKLYFASHSMGAFIMDKTNNIKQARKISANRIDSHIIALDSRFHSSKEVEKFINRYNLKTKKIGSSLKICAIAEGKADIYPRFNGTKEWDTAASDIILKESGGIIIDKKTKQELQYNKESIQNNHFIAFSKSQINGHIYNDFINEVDLIR